MKTGRSRLKQLPTILEEEAIVVAIGRDYGLNQVTASLGGIFRNTGLVKDPIACPRSDMYIFYQISVLSQRPKVLMNIARRSENLSPFFSIV